MDPSNHFFEKHNHTNDLSPTGVIQDAKFKRREALADLAKAASKQ
jgi:hypothetical protein